MNLFHTERIAHLPDYQQLIHLTLFWIKSRPLTMPSIAEPIRMSEQQRATITRHEPHQSQALNDAALLLQIPCYTGIGPGYEYTEPRMAPPTTNWPLLIQHYCIKCHWSLTMNGDYTDTNSETFEFIGYEEHQWKIISFWNAAERQQSMEFLNYIKRGKK